MCAECLLALKEEYNSLIKMPDTLRFIQKE